MKRGKDNYKEDRGKRKKARAQEREREREREKTGVSQLDTLAGKKRTMLTEKMT